MSDSERPAGVGASGGAAPQPPPDDAPTRGQQVSSPVSVSLYQNKHAGHCIRTGNVTSGFVHKGQWFQCTERQLLWGCRAFLALLLS